MRAFGFALSLIAFASLGGCSDPIPPTAKAGFLVNFSKSTASCSPGSHKGVCGDINATTLKTTITDGQKVDNSTADITCTVSGAGPFKVSGTAVLGTDGLQIEIPSIAATATKDSPATGNALFFSFETAGNQYASSECAFYFMSGTPQGIRAGEVFMAFSCPKVVGEAQECGISESFVSFSSCEQ